MSQTTDKIMKKVRIFLENIPWKKILTFSFFAVIAMILWFMQIYNQTFETNLRIPIKYVSVPDSVIFTDTLPNQIDVRVKDYGSNIFKYYFKKPDTIVIDVSPIMGAGGSGKTLQGTALEMYINKSLSQSAKILRYEPVRITFSYSILKNRKVPVIFDGQINLSPGYFLNGDIRISPDSIMVYGTTAELAKMTYVYTSSDTLNRLDSEKQFSVNLVKNKNLKYSTDNVKISVPVEAFKQMKIEVPVECLNLPDDMTVKFFPSGVSLSFFIGVSMTDSVKLGDFAVAVDYNGIKDSKSVSVPVRITSSPSYAKSLTIDPPNVEYVFEYKDIRGR